ncbi:L-amino acid N-acyltransferase YncA [Pseudomonas pohangensis]|jgi:L-amino acid N-acyltransferase YncA|uniref:L-amino acid N-acyltransferase YncA n=1 Tax=Pseudomonas pohangensis TaxID=364197 RepID=A0A1H2G7R5_9PSED|nr:GNAT family N-acetyltransferase [Pseudomonas pohangensis]SDU15550.1 L-amino acid N-acyltransferase YncA [Pseudomonas pohangensis]
MTTIREFNQADWPQVWQILEPVFRAGDTYSFPPDISEQEAFRAWVELPAATFVAADEQGQLLGSYYLKANQPGQGAHVCNCGYVVGAAARGKGIASAMCEHSQQEAIRMGFRAMQYNLVVSTNSGAVRLWQKHGFAIVGTLPQAFLHPSAGYVDAFVMYKSLAVRPSANSTEDQP